MMNMLLSVELLQIMSVTMTIVHLQDTNFSIYFSLIFQVAAGGTHSVVLTQDGHVWTWGQPWPPGDMYIFFSSWKVYHS